MNQKQAHYRPVIYITPHMYTSLHRQQNTRLFHCLQAVTLPFGQLNQNTNCSYYLDMPVGAAGENNIAGTSLLHFVVTDYSEGLFWGKNE